MKTFYYNGRTFQYDELACMPSFTLEIGRYENSYQIIQLFHTHDEAFKAYENYEVSNGYKKRLRLGKITLDKKITDRNDDYNKSL